jgi:ribosomal protein S18 acetylase RimI-like enzyme
MVSFVIRNATEEDVPALAEVAARAFVDDPLLCWLGDTRENRLNIGRHMLLADWRMNNRFGQIFCEDRQRGFAVWIPPKAEFSFWDHLSMVWEMSKAVKSTRRALNQWRLYRDIDKMHPKEDHYYLSFLGVDPVVQGKGLGGELIAPVLARADVEGMPIYLETNTEINLRFYQKHGFVIKDGLTSRDGAVQFWALWRDPVQPA